MRVSTIEPPSSSSASVLIADAGSDDNLDAEALWRNTHVRVHPEGVPEVRLIAREADTCRFLGVADYFHTFPPEDALFAVAVMPYMRRRGVGTALLRALAKTASCKGKRNLCSFVAADDETTWRLLGSAGIPVRVCQVNGGYYVELDLVSRASKHDPDSAPLPPLPNRG
jgi:GNAT superfamily N-acetyltransferase